MEGWSRRSGSGGLTDVPGLFGGAGDWDRLGRLAALDDPGDLGELGVGVSGLAQLLAFPAFVGRGRQQRPAHVAEAIRHPLDERGELADRFGDALPLGDEVLLEMIDVGLEEVPAGEQGLDLTLDLNPRRLALAASLEPGLLEQFVGLLAGPGDHPLGLRLGVSDGRVRGALGEQQRAADRLGLVGARPGGGGVGAGLGELLETGDRGPGPGLHRRGVVLGRLERRGRLLEEGVDLGRVVAPFGLLEARVADQLRVQGHWVTPRSRRNGGCAVVTA